MGGFRHYLSVSLTLVGAGASELVTGMGTRISIGDSGFRLVFGIVNDINVIYPAMFPATQHDSFCHFMFPYRSL